MDRPVYWSMTVWKAFKAMTRDNGMPVYPYFRDYDNMMSEFKKWEKETYDSERFEKEIITVNTHVKLSTLSERVYDTLVLEQIEDGEKRFINFEDALKPEEWNTKQWEEFKANIAYSVFTYRFVPIESIVFSIHERYTSETRRKKIRDVWHVSKKMIRLPLLRLLDAIEISRKKHTGRDKEMTVLRESFKPTEWTSEHWEHFLSKVVSETSGGRMPDVLDALDKVYLTGCSNYEKIKSPVVLMSESRHVKLDGKLYDIVLVLQWIDRCFMYNIVPCHPHTQRVFDYEWLTITISSANSHIERMRTQFDRNYALVIVDSTDFLFDCVRRGDRTMRAILENILVGEEEQKRDAGEEFRRMVNEQSKRNRFVEYDVGDRSKRYSHRKVKSTRDILALFESF